MEPTLRPGEVESLMSRFPTVFRQELSGIGANMERRWQFAGFKSSLSIWNWVMHDTYIIFMIMLSSVEISALWFEI
jgi:hypothetical protein